jgi:hypothetical protein
MSSLIICGMYFLKNMKSRMEGGLWEKKMGIRGGQMREGNKR